MTDLFIPRMPAVEAMFDKLASAQNYRLVGDRKLSGSWKGRAEDNVAAVRLMRMIERQNRPATPVEQAYLARFTGFGASDLANGIFPMRGVPCKPGWEQIVAELAAETTPQEWASLSRSTQYAHYTPEWAIRAVWRAVWRLGFRGGDILEPGLGTGLFWSLMPDEMVSSSILTGIENDPVTARIARLLHPRADIRDVDFTDPELRLPAQDLVIGNPPFSDRVVRAGGLKTTGLKLHEYFVWRALSALRPGGIGAFVTSRWLMDKASDKARSDIDDLADLVGAVRLPAGALREGAGTDVVVDLVFFRRRADAEDRAGERWLQTGGIECDGADVPSAINLYWHRHPEQVLGFHAVREGQWGRGYTCLATEGLVLGDALAAAIERIGQPVRELQEQPTPVDPPAPPPVVAQKAPETLALPLPVPAPRPAPARAVDPPGRIPSVRVGRAADGATVKEGSYFIAPETDALYQVIDGVPKRVEVKAGRGTTGMFQSHARIIRGLIPIRDAVREILRAQESDRPWEEAQRRLETAYRAFTRRHGPINKLLVSRSEPDEDGDVTERSRRPNIAPMMDDPDCWLIAAIEEYDASTDTATRGPIFTKRVIAPPPERVINSPADALAVVLNESGQVDLDRVAELLGVERSAAIEGLGDTIYLDPETQQWVTDDEYLSGQVQLKLLAAEKAAEGNPAFARNVTALREVQPADLPPSEITARLGAPWIPARDIMQFVIEVMGIEAPIDHTPELATWSVDLSKFRGATATSDWGTPRRHAGLLLEDGLNSRVPQVYDTEISHGVTIAKLNEAATEAAKEKLTAIKDAFAKWIWEDADRAHRLCKIYNETFNDLVPRRFTGQHLFLPGASPAVELRPHQKRGIWRIIASGASYIAHEVGAGKTFLLAGAIMEQRRLGLIDKPIIAVPGHCLAQFAKEFVQLYPNARILVADEQNFTKQKRSRFLGRAATGTWDAIIITHSAFRFIAVPTEFEEGLIKAELASYVALSARVGGEDRVSRKRIERSKEGLEAKLKALKGRTDNMITLAEIGVDQIIVDEAQNFRKLSFSTNMANLKGIDPNGSMMAWDLWLKRNLVAEKQPGRALILSSGTPITNTMGEMFTLLRFMAPEMLERRGIGEFDAWAQTFGDTRTELELQPSGLYKPVTRFSEFVNVPELIAMFRSIADVVQTNDLAEYVKLPAVRTGKRQLITAPASEAFKDYQEQLAERIRLIEARGGQAKKGEDILLSVITDGRHAAIDMRLVDAAIGDEPGNKLNLLIDRAFEIWQATSEIEYLQPGGEPYALPGAAQMIFSDLGTLAAGEKRGFSAYRWIRDRLVKLGVPPHQIAFMQQHKASQAKQKLFDAVNSGAIRFLIGSSETMGTGVNAQTRLAALHHLDVPWLPSQIGQREGRIRRQGNQNDEIDIYAYATLGSLDAQMWQTNERKQRFISAVLAGDRTIRRLADLEADSVNQFAMAKAIASGDQRLMQKAGLEADIARLFRQRDAHLDDQYNVRAHIEEAERQVARAEAMLPKVDADLAVYQDTRGEAFSLMVDGHTYTERKVAGAALLSRLRTLERNRQRGAFPIGIFAGFPLSADVRRRPRLDDVVEYVVDLVIERQTEEKDITIEENMSALGLVQRMERALDFITEERSYWEGRLQSAQRRLADYRPRLGGRFGLQDELDAKRAELEALDDDLRRTTKSPRAVSA